jgi:hypothetical protein
MKYSIVLTLTALILNLGCEKKDVGQSPAGNGKSPISTPEQASVDVAKEHELAVRPVTPIPKGGEAPELHVRYNLTARHAGKLLVRVREPLLATDPPLLGRVPGFISARRAPWADAAGSLESDGLAQRVLELSDEDVAAPLAIEVRMVHSTVPDEMVSDSRTDVRSIQQDCLGAKRLSLHAQSDQEHPPSDDGLLPRSFPVSHHLQVIAVRS